MQFDHLAVGGTFDLLHIGHKNFLTGAIRLARKVTVGITSDEMATELGKTTFYSYKERARNVSGFLQTSGTDIPWQIIKISDVFGTTTKDKTIDAVCVTRDTYDGALKINGVRMSMNMKRLEVVQLPITLASDGKPVSSGRIKSGQLSQDGLNYFMHISSFGNSRLTMGLRKELGKPQGLLYPDLRTLMKEGALDSDKLISVGDQITYNLLHMKVIPSLAVVDFKIERKEVFKNLAALGFSDDQTYAVANNPHGEITQDLVSKLHTLLGAKTASRVLVVKGEEDLSVLPATLMSPLGYRIVYGQRNAGIVSIDVDPPTKRRFLNLFDEFEKDIST